MKMRHTLLLATTTLAAWLSVLAPVGDAEAQFKAGTPLTAAALNAALAGPTITSGSIDGATVGNTAPATGKFTTLQSLGTTTLTPSGTVTIYPTTQGTMDNIAIGTASPVSARFSTLTVNGVTLGLLTGTSASLGGSNLAAGACTSGTVAIASTDTPMVVSTSPKVYPGDAIFWKGYVSTPGTVTIKVCAVISATPTASAYNVRVIQ